MINISAAALRDRLLDYDENVRKEVVAAIFTMAYHSVLSIPCATVRLVAERLRDKSVLLLTLLTILYFIWKLVYTTLVQSIISSKIFSGLC